MLFRPSFCANCGEKIERKDWGVLTSRRFCEVCEIEFRGHEWGPKVAGGLVLVVALGAIGLNLTRRASTDDRAAVVRARPFAERPVNVPAQPSPASVRTEESPVPPPIQSREPQPVPLKPVVAASEPVYYCGAETKKGTPCSRRVKGNVRCFQHVGMPAMAGAEKLTAIK